MLLRIFREPRVRSLIGFLLLTLLFVFYLAFVAANLTTTFDDAYMFLRYSNNALNGYSVAWNPDGVQTYGATSLLYLALIVLGRVLFPLVNGSAVLVVTSSTLGLAALVLMSAGCYRLSTSGLLKSHPLAPALLLAFLFVLSPTFLFHATSGMDTTLAALCNTLLIFAALHWTAKKNTASTAWLVLAAYASFLARPDNLIYSILFPVSYGYFFHREDRIQKVFQFLTVLIGIIAIDTLGKYFIFGDPLPLPFYAKTVGYDDGYAGAFRWNPISYLFDFFKLMLPFMLVIIFSMSKRTSTLVLAFFLPVTVTFAYYFSVTQIMGFGARYYFPSLPYFVVGGFLMLDTALQKTNFTDLFKSPLRAGAAAVLVLFVLLSPVRILFADLYEDRFIPAPHIYGSETTKDIKPALPVLGWLQIDAAMAEICSQLPAGTRIAMSEYGLVGAEAPQVHIIDPLGLHDPFFAHNGFSGSEFFSRNPDLIWFPHPDYTRIISLILDDPRLWQEYEYYPGAFDYGIAIRMDSVYYEEIVRIVANTWRTTYPGVNMSSSLAGSH